jgi:hypothetical protein
LEFSVLNKKWKHRRTDALTWRRRLEGVAARFSCPSISRLILLAGG